MSDLTRIDNKLTQLDNKIDRLDDKVDTLIASEAKNSEAISWLRGRSVRATSTL